VIRCDIDSESDKVKMPIPYETLKSFSQGIMSGLGGMNKIYFCAQKLTPFKHEYE
jgi:hypothetical protein